MATKANAGPAQLQARAEASFKKEERAKEGAQAMLEYLASGREVRENMAKLKALRLAKQAADEAAGGTAKVAAEDVTKLAKKGSAKLKKPRALKRTHQ